jgi:hypothetical protein
LKVTCPSLAKTAGAHWKPGLESLKSLSTGLHFNILSSVGVIQVNRAECKKQGVKIQHIFKNKPFSGKVSVN